MGTNEMRRKKKADKPAVMEINLSRVNLVENGIPEAFMHHKVEPKANGFYYFLTLEDITENEKYEISSALCEVTVNQENRLSVDYVWSVKSRQYFDKRIMPQMKSLTHTVCTKAATDIVEKAEQSTVQRIQQKRCL